MTRCIYQNRLVPPLLVKHFDYGCWCLLWPASHL